MHFLPFKLNIKTIVNNKEIKVIGEIKGINFLSLIKPRILKFFSYDVEKINGMTNDEKAKFLHNYIYVEDREKSETKNLKCK